MLGERLLAWRGAAPGRTQAAVAAELGVSQQAVNAWEKTGRIEFKNAIRVCDLIGITGEDRRAVLAASLGMTSEELDAALAGDERGAA